MKDLLRKIRNYEIKIRKAVRSQMSGEVRSIFKGSGLEFDDIRVYQYGDDVRTIDWNVSARSDETYIKTFREEKDQAVYFLTDLSASHNYGTKGKKIDTLKEVTSVLALSAIHQNSQVGLIGFTDNKEKFIKANKGEKHGVFLIKELFKHQAKSKKTDLNKGIRLGLGMIKRTSIVVLLSDFIDDSYDLSLKALARKHDLIVVKITDKKDHKHPRIGIAPIRDPESDRVSWANTSFGRTRRLLKENRSKSLEGLCKRNRADFVEIEVGENYVPKLTQLFLNRNTTWKHG